MSKRLQVLLEDADMREIQRLAKSQGMTVLDGVRAALQAAKRAAPAWDPGRKLAAIRAAARHAYPTSDIRTMLVEIERRYGVDDSK